MRDSRCFRNNVEPSMYFVTGTKSQFSHPVGVFVIGDFFSYHCLSWDNGLNCLSLVQ